MAILLMLCCTVVLVFGCSKVENAQPPAEQQEATGSSGTAVLESREGRASYMARVLDGRKTASGRIFDSSAMVAAHPTYPFGTIIRVIHTESGRSVEVQVIDRGPASAAREEGVIIDLSRAAAEGLGFVQEGRARVRLEVLSWGARNAAS